jgi:hypothetical protein
LYIMVSSLFRLPLSGLSTKTIQPSLVHAFIAHPSSLAGVISVASLCHAAASLSQSEITRSFCGFPAKFVVFKFSCGSRAFPIGTRSILSAKSDQPLTPTLLVASGLVRRGGCDLTPLISIHYSTCTAIRASSARHFSFSG